MKPLLTPTINLNGNTAQDLLEKLRLVLHNINHLKESMRDASDIVHGRNFQLDQDPVNKQREAQAAWYERFVMVNDLHDEVLALALDIQAQDRRYASH